MMEWQHEQLCKTLELITSHINENLSRRQPCDEVQTRAWLIHRVLRALGWDPDDPALVHPEWPRPGGSSKRADYALLGSLGKPIAILETKRLRTDLGEAKHVEQVVQYGNNAGVSWGILSNGKEWRLYDLAGLPKPAEDRCVWKVSIDDPSAHTKLQELHRENLCASNVAESGKSRRELASTLKSEADGLVRAVNTAINRPDNALLDRVAGLCALPKDRVRELWPYIRHVVKGPTMTEMDELETRTFAPPSQAVKPLNAVSSAPTVAVGEKSVDISWLKITDPPPSRRKPQFLRLNGEVQEVAAWYHFVHLVALAAAQKHPARFAEALSDSQFELPAQMRLLAVDKKRMVGGVKVVRGKEGYVETYFANGAAAVQAAQLIAHYVFGADVELFYAQGPARVKA